MTQKLSVGAVGLGHFRRLAQRWFPDRQLLIRGADRLHCVAITQKQQLVAVTAGAVFTIAFGSFCLIAVWSARDAAFAARSARAMAAQVAANQAELRQITARNIALTAERDLAIAQSAKIRDEAVAAAVAKLTRVHDAAAEKAALARDNAVAQQTLVAAANAAAMQRLQTQTESTINQVEAIIKSTGLDPDRLVDEPGAVPARKPDGSIDWSGISPAEQSHDNLLLNDVGRLQALGSVLGQMPLAAPVSFIAVTSPFGYRPDPWTGTREFHAGVDLRGPIGTPVYATAPGTVTFAGDETGYGLIVIIDHGDGFTTRYSHLDKIKVSVGQKISLHEQIALLGNTGWSTGPHLLYETRVNGQPENPMQFIKEADVQK